MKMVSINGIFEYEDCIFNKIKPCDDFVGTIFYLKSRINHANT